MLPSRVHAVDDISRLKSKQAMFGVLVGRNNPAALQQWREGQEAVTGLVIAGETSPAVRDWIWGGISKAGIAKRLWTNVRMSSNDNQLEEYLVRKAGREAREHDGLLIEPGAGPKTPHGEALSQLHVMMDMSKDPLLSGVSYALMGRSRALFQTLEPFWPDKVARGQSMSFHEVFNELELEFIDDAHLLFPRGNGFPALSSREWSALVEYSHDLMSDVPDLIGVKIGVMEKESRDSLGQAPATEVAKTPHAVTRKPGVGERWTELGL